MMQFRVQAEHCPAAHARPAAQVPHVPPHPSPPHDFPEHSGEHATHEAPWHRAPAAQAPHVPPHPSPPQAPGAQRGVQRTHVPSTHDHSGLHAAPHVPQFVRSLVRETHAPAQQLPPTHAGEHTRPPPSSVPRASAWTVVCPSRPSDPSLADSSLLVGDEASAPPTPSSALPPHPNARHAGTTVHRGVSCMMSCLEACFERRPRPILTRATRSGKRGRQVRTFCMTTRALRCTT